MYFHLYLQTIKLAMQKYIIRPVYIVVFILDTSNWLV